MYLFVRVCFLIKNRRFYKGQVQIMANKARSSEMINFQKQQMSKAALEIIVKEGYDSLSIRKLSGKLSVSQATIYNYFKNRDEIYIYVLNSGFEMLYKELESARDSVTAIVDKLRHICKAFLSFGIRERDLTFIMAILDTPKYLDYLETEYEPDMRIELSNALRCKEIFRQVITEISGSNRSIPDKDIEYRTFQIITQLIGLITIYNNNLIKYMVEDINETIERSLRDIIQPFEISKKKNG